MVKNDMNEKLVQVVDDVVKAEATVEIVPVVGANTVLSMVGNIEKQIVYIEENLDNFAAHEKAAVQQWLLGLKIRVRALLSRIV